MLGDWEYTLNKFVEDNGGISVTLNSILSNVNKKERIFALNSDYATVRYIEEQEYREDVYSYVEPEFHEATNKIGVVPRFVLFSAPGATGKSALAKHICYIQNGIYWDLPDNKIAEYSFQGALTKAVGYANVSEFVKSIESGKAFLVIDAFDEAEASSGRSGIEYFLRDLNSVTENCTNTCAILMARTESAIFIKSYLERNGIPYKHYEVGYFAEYNAKTYIENKIKRANISISSVVKDCIEEQFNEIHRIFPGEEAKEFLGYAPVLDALAAAYNEERNTSVLLRDTSSGENNCQLMIKILNHLLTREQEKFVKALKNKIVDKDIEINFESIYTKDEQLERIIGKLLFDDTTIFGDISDEVPVEYRDEYLEVINTQLPQHPFILSKDDNAEVRYEFTGPAFRDYAIAFGLANQEMHDFVSEFMADNRKYCPSQMLIEYYEIFTDKKISGKDIPLMYNSFKAHAHIGDRVSLYVSGAEEECYVEFQLLRDGNFIKTSEFFLNDLQDGIFINQISDCYIDIAGKIYIGNTCGEARINNSTIICDEIIWGSEQILIEAYSPGECIISTNMLTEFPNVNPRFELKVDEKKNLKISSNNIGSYYKLLGYKNEDVLLEEDESFYSFANIIRRIFSCLRSHSKDTPARKMDFIDNRIINSNKKKKNILKFLIDRGIIFTDEQDWLYKLETDKLGEYSIMWNAVRNGELTSLQKLYFEYEKENW